MDSLPSLAKDNVPKWRRWRLIEIAAQISGLCLRLRVGSLVLHSSGLNPEITFKCV